MLCRLWNRALLSNPDRGVWNLSPVPPVPVSCPPTNTVLSNIELLLCATMVADWITWKESLLMAHARCPGYMVDRSAD